MGKPRQGTSSPLIIDIPELITPRRKLIESGVTVLLWVSWLYFIAPIITLLLWAFGIKYFYEVFFPGGGLGSLISLLKGGGITVAVILFIDIAWIDYNYYFLFKVFGIKKEYVPHATMQDFAKMLHADPEAVEHMNRENRIDVTIEGNRLVIVKSK